MQINLKTKQGWDDLKRELDDRMLDVLRALRLPDPKGNGTILMCDPTGGDANPSFVIWTRKPGGLSWKRYGSIYGGKTLELIAYINGWFHAPKKGADEAARWAISQLGLGEIDAAQLSRDRAAAQARRVNENKAAAEELRRRQSAAFQTFVKDSIPILGVSGEGTGAEIYLRDARGIDLRKAPFIGPRGGATPPHALRFKAQHKYIHRDRSGKKIRESYHPAMIACCVDRQMKIRAIHQTYLRDDFSDKADLAPTPDGHKQPARKVWPESAGCVIPLWRGDGHFTPQEAKDHGLLQTLVLTEGVEDGLSAVLAGPDLRVWAMISLSNMANVAQRLPDCCDSVIVHRQNDWQKLEAVAAFNAGLGAIRATGRAVAVVAAIEGKDLNDTLRGVA